MSVIVRPAGVSDAPWLAGYVAEHFGRARPAAELRDGRMVTRIAEADGGPAGYAQLGRGKAPPSVTGPAPMEIVRFYVDRPWHGRGLAHELMAAAAETARAAGARTLWLGVWERNPRAIAFYRKCGFEDVGTQIFVLGADHQQDLVLARALA